MTRETRLGAWFGVVAAIALLVVTVSVQLLGPTPPGGPGERWMGVWIAVTRVGVPITYLIAQSIDRFGSNAAAPLAAILLLPLAMVAQWALVGALVGRWVGTLRKRAS